MAVSSKNLDGSDSGNDQTKPSRGEHRGGSNSFDGRGPARHRCCRVQDHRGRSPLSRAPREDDWAVTASTMSNFTGDVGGFNGSTQHLGRTQLALKTKAKSLAQVKTARALPWLGLERVWPNGWIPPGKHC